MSVRRAEGADLDALVVLEETIFAAEAWSRRLVREALPHAWVLDDLTGWAVLSVVGDVADLQRIGVRARRRGGGRRLLDAALADLDPATRVLLEVRADNEAGHGFYAAAGFVEIDRRRRYYRDGTDALVLEATAGDVRRPHTPDRRT